MADKLHSSTSSTDSSSQNTTQDSEGAVQAVSALELLPSRKLNQQILDSSEDCIKVLDLEGQLLFMNQGGQALLGIEDITPFLNTSWVKFWQESEQQTAIEAIARARAGEVCTLQGYCPTLSGEPKWWDNKITPIRGAEGQVERLLCISRDITERRRAKDERNRAEERLRESEKHLSAIFSQAAVGLSEISLDGQFQRVNDELCRILGRPRQEMLAASLSDMTHPEDVSASLEAFKQLIETGQPVSLDKRYLRPDGTTVWANNRLTRLDDEQGHPRTVLAVTVDLSNRKRTELNAELLATMTQDLMEATCVDEILQTVGKQLHRYLKTSGCTFVEINESLDEAVIQCAWHQEGVPSLVGVYRLPEFVTDQFFQAAKAGKAIVVRDVSTDPQITNPQRFDALKIGAFINIPLIKDGEWKSTLGIYHQAAYNWHPDEIELLRELANRIWTKLERTYAEAALRESEEKYRSLFESIDEGFCIVEMIFDAEEKPVDYRFIQLNPAFCRLTGFSEDALGKTARQIVPNVEEFWFEVYGEVAKTGKAVRFQNKSEPMNRWFDVYASRVGDAASRRVAIVFNNITDRKQAEAILQRSARLDAFRVSFADVLRPLADPVEIQATASCVLGQYLNANRVAYFEVRGSDYFVEQDYVNGVQPLVGGYSIHSFGSKLLAAYRTGRAVSASDVQTDPHLSPEQRSAYAAIEIGAYIGVPIIKAGEFVAGLAVHTLGSRHWTAEEVTLTEEVAQRIWEAVERARIEAALRDSENRFRMAIESAQLGTWDWNLLTNQLIWDEGCKAMFGLPPEAEINIEVFFAGLHPDDRERLGKVMRWALNPASDGKYDTEYRTIGLQDQVERWVAARGQAYFDAAGNPQRFIGTVLNITEQKRIEVQREHLLQREQTAREAAENANRIKDEFLAVVSHELRSPLNPILGWAKLLQNSKLDAAKTQQALKTIERNAQLQSELIEDLLDVSRILQGKLNLNVNSIDLTPIIGAAMETVRLAAEAKSIQIEANLEPEIGLIFGDATRMQQVIWNLLSNAVKFTPGGGQVNIRLKRIDSHAYLIVSDTGQGIAPDFLPYVFDYFRQADGATTRKFGGLGLGLAIVRHLVELHGGTVNVESPGVGMGATFTVRLPLIPTQATAQLNHQPSELASDLNGIRALVVDDEPDSREFIAFVLAQAGAKVVTATTAKEALSMLTRWQPDVLVSDIGMPEMDGYMLIQQVRALPPEQGGQVKAIALTAYAGDSNQQQALQAGFQRHLSKPVEPEVFVRAVASLLNPISCESSEL